MKRIGILLAAIGLSAFAGGAPASAQYSALEKIQYYYTDASHSQLSATVKFWCDGWIEGDGGFITSEMVEDYYGC